MTRPANHLARWTTSLALAAAAHAAPFDHRLVPADAAWIVHLDVEAAVRSSLGRFLLEAPGNDLSLFASREAIRELNAHLGVDVTRDLKSVTISGPDENEHHVIAVLTLSPAIDDALRRFQATEPDLVLHQRDGYTEIHWHEDDEDRFAALLPAPDPALRILAIASSPDRAALAANVVAGRAERLSLHDRQRPGPSAILWVSSTDFGHALARHAEAHALRKADGGALEFGEHDNRLYANVALVAESPEDATAIAQVFTGLLAMGRLVAGNDPELANLLSLVGNVHPAVEDRTVSLAWSQPSDKVISALRSLLERHGHDHDEDHDHDDENHDPNPPKKSRKPVRPEI